MAIDNRTDPQEDQSITERARERLSDATSAVTDRARETYDSGRAAAQRALDKSSDAFESNPLAIVAGGVVLGAVLGALLPITDQERRTLGSAGRRVNQRAKDALDAAKESGRDKLGDLNLDADGLRDQAKGLFSKLGEAAKAAASAAGEQARGSSEGSGTGSATSY